MQRQMLNVLPAYALGIVRNVIRINFGAELSNVNSQGEEPPLPDETEVELCRDKWQQDSDGMAGGEDVHEEEVVGVRSRLDSSH